MITLITGENSYERDREVARIIAACAGESERLDGAALTASDLPQLFQGMTLFATERLTIITNLSENKEVWGELEKWLDTPMSDTHIVLVEPKPDKRTKTYKALQKQAQVKQCEPFGERGTGKAENWLKREAKTRQIEMNADAARELVRRVGTDQYRLVNELERLAPLGSITTEVVAAHTEEPLGDNVFTLLQVALSGDTVQLHAKIHALQHTNDAYMTLGLLSSQLFNLAALKLGDGTTAEIASSVKASEFALRPLVPLAAKISREQLKTAVQYIAEADIQTKTTASDPWIILESALMRIAAQQKSA